MASNSKLLSSEKADLKALKKSMPKNMAFAQSGPVTVLVRVMTNCVHVSTALASPNEKKFWLKLASIGPLNGCSRIFMCRCRDRTCTPIMGKATRKHKRNTSHHFLTKVKKNPANRRVFLYLKYKHLLIFEAPIIHYNWRPCQAFFH